MNCGGTGGCSGAVVQLGLGYVGFYGLVEESKMPYKGKESGTCGFDGAKMKADVIVDGYERLPVNDYDAVMTALINKGPLAISVSANEHWFDYAEGVFDGCPYN